MGKGKKGKAGGKPQGQQKALPAPKPLSTFSVASLLPGPRDCFVMKHTPRAAEGTDVGAIRGTSSYVDAMLELIPAKFYVPISDAERELTWSKYYKNKSGSAPKQDVKEASKKAKRARYDVESQRKVQDLIEEREAEEDTAGATVVAEGRALLRAPVATGAPASLDDLRQRLHAKIEAMRAARKATEGDGEGAAAKKANRKRRKEEAKPKAKRTRTAAPAPAAAATNGGSLLPTVEDHLSMTALKAVTAGKSQLMGVGSVAVVATAGAGASAGGKPKRKQSLKKLLAKAEQNKSRLDALRKESGEVPEAVWDAAAQRAAGDKVKDDPKLLVKALKRREKKKEKSRKTWGDRQETVKKAQADRQAKRTENLKARASKKVSKILGKKKGGRAGFEGKRKSFVS